MKMIDEKKEELLLCVEFEDQMQRQEKNSTGGVISVVWHCPYCGGYNTGVYFTSNVDVLGDSFEVDHDCEDCGKMVTIECVDFEDDLFD